jgi:aspartyl-tRNA synthetase
MGPGLRRDDAHNSTQKANMSRTLITNSIEQTGKTITVKGWVNSRRDHGGLIFIDVRDHTGILQVVIQPENAEAFKESEHLRDEYVVAITGDVKERKAELQNPNLPTGTVELVASEVTVLNKSEALPILVNSTQTVSEENRLKYRYLDLRRAKMQNMLAKRSEFYAYMRNYMRENLFIEVSTPILANSSPEGARDFLVPSRVYPGKFYALPQAPQQFKQLLMVGGVPRYYQIATCFRDEDPRADRLYGDFYQLDLEMSFVDDGEEVRSTMEPLIKKLVIDFGGKKLLYEDVPRYTHHEVMERFGSDKPDLRFGMELTELTELAKNCEFGVFSNVANAGGVVKAVCVKNGASLSRSQIDNFTEVAKSAGAGGLPYMTIVEGKATSSISKFFTEDQLSNIVETMDAKDGDAIFFSSDKRNVVNKVLGTLRNAFADHFELRDPNVVALAWVIDFPFYEIDVKSGKLDFGHNPFSMPKGGSLGLDIDDKTTIVADQYDMVMNGYEICSGAVRNHNPDTMYKVFGILGYDEKYVEEKFGAMLSAFKFGAPPHAGCAFGIDRIFMVLQDEDNIREVIAFPKNGSGVDVMMNSPSSVDEAQLRDLSLKLNLPVKLA